MLLNLGGYTDMHLVRLWDPLRNTRRVEKNLLLSRNFQHFSNQTRFAASVTFEILAALLKILLL